MKKFLAQRKITSMGNKWYSDTILVIFLKMEFQKKKNTIVGSSEFQNHSQWLDQTNTWSNNSVIVLAFFEKKSMIGSSANFPSPNSNGQG